MRFFKKYTAQSIGISPGPGFEPPPPVQEYEHNGYSVTIKPVNGEPHSHHHLISYSLERTILILRLSNRTKFIYPLENIEWFSTSQEGELHGQTPKSESGLTT